MRNLIAKLALAAAVLGGGLGTAAAETANIWVRADGSNFMPRIVDAYNKAHTNQVKLDIIPNAEIIPKYGAAAAGGTAPDALSLDLIYTPSFAAAGQLEDITDWAKSLPYFASLSPAHVKTGTYKDHIYG
ncbi:extracellular solute-binding protein, partial [Mesorhizobium sp. M7A.F.Ca.US.001.02.1.1]